MSNELIRELVEALEYSSDFLSRSASRFDDVIETLTKARAYLETGGWTKVSDGLPVVPDGDDVPPATILTEHEMRDMLIACRSSVKFDMNQMELTALKPSLSAVSRDVADKEAQRLALLLGRIDALAGTE